LSIFSFYYIFLSIFSFYYIFLTILPIFSFYYIFYYFYIFLAATPSFQNVYKKLGDKFYAIYIIFYINLFYIFNSFYNLSLCFY